MMVLMMYSQSHYLLPPCERSHCCFNFRKITVSGLEPNPSQIKALVLSTINATSTTNARIPIESPLKRDYSESPIPKSSSNDVYVPLGSHCPKGLCLCGRRRFIGASGAALLPTFPSNASDLKPDQAAMLERIHPPRPDWYEEFYALVLEKGMKAYEVEVAGYKSELFSKLRGRSKKVLELGIGTGPNLKYYASGGEVYVYGVDPNKKMEKYAREAAVAAGLPPSNFNFIQTVGEALPLNDASMDIVVGTLVLCSVVDVSLTLEEVKRVLKPGGLYIFMEHVAAQDGTALKFIQGILDPLQQIVADGCHLTRETGKDIAEAGFSGVDINMAFIPSVFPLSPHIYGIACK
ncbi:methyltransferase-like protein 7B [Macadamia integrifolia]|uniref:methyltransferase-like protein 7B n=1 Tax=Macadamia integrifolia TaxID=60698 RepID=UPI001C4FBC2D|nr:methyltransferase-like protein 7B [Macadamia integrifolia]